MIDSRVRRLLAQCEQQVEDEDRAKPLYAAVQLLRQAEAAGVARPESLSPENYLLCAEVALTVDDTEVARSSVERFLASRPTSNQFLVRAHYALGQVLALECATAKGELFVQGILGALAEVQKGLATAAELGSAHRFLVYNGSVHVYNLARPLFTSVAGANELAAVLDGVLKQLAAAEEPDAEWRLRLSMELVRCMERSGRKKEAIPVLATLGPLAEASPPTMQARSRPSTATAPALLSAALLSAALFPPPRRPLLAAPPRPPRCPDAGSVPLSASTERPDAARRSSCCSCKRAYSPTTPRRSRSSATTTRKCRAARRCSRCRPSPRAA